MNVLIIGGGTQGLAFIRSLYKLGHHTFLLYDDAGNYADASRYCTVKIASTLKHDDEGYLPYLLSILRDNKIDSLIPMGDESARFVSSHISEIQEFTKVKFPTIDIFLKGYDKNQLMALCEDKSYPHPKTADLSVISLSDSAIKDFPFPAMLKPNLTTGGRGMARIESYEELLKKYTDLHQTYGEYHLQEFIPAGGRQFKVQIYIDEEQALTQATVMQKVRWFPINAGSNCCGVSIENEQLKDTCYAILKDISWVGFADFDIIEDPRDGRMLVMEINPRVPACIQLPIAAGVNWPEIILNGNLGLPQKDYSYRTGVVLRHLGLDVLWFLKSNLRWKSRPSWFSFLGRNIYYQDISNWSDPAPFWAGTIHNIKSLLNPDFKKAKGIQ